MPVDPHWLRGPADALAVAEGCTFDAAAGRFACDFIETFCRQSKGRWAGRPLELLDWQRDFLMRLFGWKRADGLRRYRRAYLEVAKKNGKSTLVSGLTLFLLLADGEGAPEIYLNACDRKQAEIIFDEAARMVRASPALASRLDVVRTTSRIVWPEGNGVIRANSADAPNKDGLNPSATIFDELHRQPDRELWDVFEYAGAAREQPLTISITTAGEDESGVWFEQREYSEKVNAGIIPDATHLGVIYRAEESDDLDDPATWRKANPSLGETISEGDFRREWGEAKQIPAKQANFRRLRLNIVTRSAAALIPSGAWDECPVGAFDLDGLDGRPWYAGLDLSSIEDITAFVAIAGDAEDGLDAWCRFYLPEGNIVDLERRHRVPYRAWAERGFITLTPGEVVDYGFVRADIKAMAAEGELRRLMVDRYNATQLATQLAEEDGLPVEYLQQGYLSLSPPTKELIRLILARKLRHGGHPVLRWMASNAIVDTDPAGNIKLSKKKSRNKVDGMAALVNALAGWLADAGRPAEAAPTVEWI
jgi:phage terminase large subunit-like protein